ncbi:hypothetical protein RR48_01024, partial [Papilio machaon]
GRVGELRTRGKYGLASIYSFPPPRGSPVLSSVSFRHFSATQKLTTAGYAQFESTPEKKNLEAKEQKKLDKKRKAQEKENKTTSNKLKKKSTVIHPPKTGLCVQSVTSGLMRPALQEVLLKALLVIFVYDVDLVRKYPMLSVINSGSVRIYPERYG